MQVDDEKARRERDLAQQQKGHGWIFCIVLFSFQKVNAQILTLHHQAFG